MKLRWKIAQAAEIRWWQNYLKKKPKADYLVWKANYWTTFLEKIGVTVKAGERLADIGCGPAGVFMILKDNPVVAIDPLLDSYEGKLKHFKKEEYPNVSFVSTPLEKYENTAQFDTIFCLNAINHVADLGLCFDKLMQLTKKGGTLVVSIDAHNYQAFKHIFRLLPGDILHPHQYDLKEYQDMLTSRGATLQNSVLYTKEFFFDYYVLVFKKEY